MGHSLPPLFVTLVFCWYGTHHSIWSKSCFHVFGMRGMIREVYFPAFEHCKLDGKGAPLMQLALCHFRSQSYKLCGGHVEGHSFLAECVFYPLPAHPFSFIPYIQSLVWLGNHHWSCTYKYQGYSISCLQSNLLLLQIQTQIYFILQFCCVVDFAWLIL